jgi:hypothetical protein
MSKKSRERRKARLEAKAQGKGKPEPTSPATLEALKRRRNRRFLFVGLIGLSFPILELIAYQFRTITISVINKSDMPIKKLKVTYAGGDFADDELKPGQAITRVVRPDFSFTSNQFSTYPLTIRFSAGSGFNSQIGRAGALDFSATEIYTIVNLPDNSGVQIQHTTRAGFPLSLVRDVLERLGFR